MNRQPSSESDSTSDLQDTNKTPPKKCRRLCTYNKNWEEKNTWLKKNDEFNAECKLCMNCFNISIGGYNSVVRHSTSKKHQTKLKACKMSNVVNKYFVVQNSFEEELVIAAEITKIYHTIKHNQSYNSLDCSFKLDKLIFEDSKLASKISCGRTKCEAIAQNVLAPRSLFYVFQKIKNHNPPLFYSIQTDASNKKNIKFFPICIQIFTKEEGQQNFIIDFIENSDETADGMLKMIDNIFINTELKWEQVSGFSGDNCSANFGVHHSLFTNIKGKNPNVIKSNCHAHILHNCVKKAMDYLDIDVENLILKMYSHFSISAKRRETLKEFHTFVEIEWKELIRHVGTRWLSLLPCVDRILHNYQALVSYFLSLGSDCPKQIQLLLKITEESHTVSEEIEIYLLFCNHILPMFNNAVKIIEKNSTTVIELFSIMLNVKNSLLSRKNEQFFGFVTNQKLNSLQDINLKSTIIKNFNLFFDEALKYLNNHFDFDENQNWLFKLTHFQLSQNKFPNYKHFEAIIHHIPQLQKIDFDKLFDEIMTVQLVFREFTTSKDWENVKTISEKWQFIFQKDIELPNMFIFISFLLTLPASSAFTERVFSVMNIKWRDERNRCSTALIRAELLIYFNYKKDCLGFSNSVKNDKDLIKLAKNQNKYSFK